ncbi:MAG: hypothetical protein JWM14_2340 [Chitinophagaceae bacterium]|nr:hypothetical protein [Chitinophagaceae bacterium]
MNQHFPKKILIFSAFFILLITLFQLFYNEKDVLLFSENSFEREMEEEEEGGIPLEDRIDLAMRQEFEMTKDPATGTVPRERLLIARDTLVERQKRNSSQLRTSASIAAINWTERGPNNSGGRTRAIWVDKNDATGKTVWTGSVGGGLWKTTDITVASPVWTPVNDFFANLAITGITQNPLNTQEMYFSTGEAYFNADYVRGLGVFKSTDGGVTWNQLAATATPGGNFAYIYRIKVSASGVLYVATYFNGLYRSTNGGTTFTKVLGTGLGITGAASNRCFDIEFAANGDIYASLNGSIHKSADGGVTFGAAMTLPMAASRIELATAPNDANYVYALTQSTATGQTSNVGSIIRTTDAGANWTSLSLPADADPGVGTADFSRGQAWYDLALAIDPNDKNIVYTGAIDLFKSTNGGTSWTQISHWYGGFGYQNVHADNHLIYFQPGSSTIIYFGNDGGIYRSANGTAATPTISYRGAGYRTIQFYGCAMHPTSGSNFFLAGAQDNGSHKFSIAGLGPTTSASGGDGAFCNIDQNQPAYMWTQYVYNSYYRSTNGGATFSHVTFPNNYDQKGNSQFINPSDYDNTSNHLYAADAKGRYFYWADPQTGNTIDTIVIAAFGAANKVSAVTCSDAITDLVYFGLDNGDVFKVSNANTAAPIATNLSTGLPGGYVSCVTLERGNENHMLVTYSNYGVNSVWESTNGGTSWTSVEGNLPDMPVRWAMFNPNDGTQALIATELGVWSTDLLNGASTNWGPSNSGLANVRTDMLQYRTSDNLIIASTHGRGLFSTTISSPTPLTWLSFEAKKSGAHALLHWATTGETNNAGFEIERSEDGTNFNKLGYILPQGASIPVNQYAYTDYDCKLGKQYYYRVKQIDKDGHFDYSNIVRVVMDDQVAFDFDQLYPNPFSNQLTLSFTTDDNAPIQIQLRNIESEIVYETTIKNGSEKLTINFNNHPLPAGTYFITANKQGEVVSRKVMKSQ